MTAKYKDYVDSLNAIANKRMDGIENRITIIENQSGDSAVPTEAQSASVLTITLEDLRAMLTTEITLCLKQHQEQVQAEEEALKKKRAEEQALKIAEKRREAEAAGRRYIASTPEWFDLIYKTQNTHYKRIKDTFRGFAAIGETFNRSLIELQKTSDNIVKLVTSSPTKPKPISIFANLPSGLRAKIKELRNRIQDRLHTYLNGSYSLHRGYTLLIVILYGLLMVVFAVFKISISVLG